jgi:hypothetical protein
MLSLAARVNGLHPLPDLDHESAGLGDMPVCSVAAMEARHAKQGKDLKI